AETEVIGLRRRNRAADTPKLQPQTEVAIHMPWFTLASNTRFRKGILSGTQVAVRMGRSFQGTMRSHYSIPSSLLLALVMLTGATTAKADACFPTVTTLSGFI